MPWKKPSAFKLRAELVRRAREADQSFLRLCEEFGVSAKTGYKWCARHRRGGWLALQEQSRCPRRRPQGYSKRCREAVRQLRLRWPRWGPKKLRALLGRAHPRWRLPGVSTIGRWLKEWQLQGRRTRRARRGPSLRRGALTKAPCPNEVWTLDFKGWFRTADGCRCEPLTVRDLCSRYTLGIVLLADQSDGPTRRALQRIFRRHGLPKVIRVDNGAPFAGKGALGLSRLSVWWLRLGIRVEFTRRARPGDNASHEQMHRILKADTLCPPAATRPTQQRRLQCWIKEYNLVRPHEALGQESPAKRYRDSPRKLPQKLQACRYPADWTVRRVRPHGEIKWQGRLRFIGRAFVGEQVGLKVHSHGRQEVFLADQLIGRLCATDPTGMRAARWHWGRVSRPPTARR